VSHLILAHYVPGYDGPAEHLERFFAEKELNFTLILFPLKSENKVVLKRDYKNGVLFRVSKYRQIGFTYFRFLSEFLYLIPLDKPRKIYAFDDLVFINCRIRWWSNTSITRWFVDVYPFLILQLIHKLLRILVLNLANHIVFNTQSAKDFQRKYMFKMSYNKSRVVRIGIQDEIVIRRTVKDLEKVFIYFGRLDNRNNAILVAEISKVLRGLNSSFRVEIIGTGPLEKFILANYTNEIESKHLVMHGFIQDYFKVAEILAKSKIAIAPYADLPLSLTKYADPGKIKMYIHCGLPVLVSDVFLDKEYLIELGCEVIDPNESPDSWVSRLFKMVDDESFRILNDKVERSKLRVSQRHIFNQYFQDDEVIS
jgi:glycosyltransferase involved in cell wall biosynthesis